MPLPIQIARIRQRCTCAAAILALSLSASCAPGSEVASDFQALSLSGDSLFTPLIANPTKAEYETRLAEARAALENTPDNVDSIIWFGRRTAYLGLYRQAIDIFTDGIQRYPNDARLYRHRGHRYITIRRLDLAIADFEMAASLFEGQPDEIEPDGLPNAQNIPTSTLQGNVWYHLGLAHFLRQDWESAAEAYRRGMEIEMSTDMHIAFANWYYLTLMRMGLTDAAAAVIAPIDADTEIIENTAYLDLVFLYKGLLPVDSLLAPNSDELAGATTAYGVGNWYLYNGDTTRATQVFESALGSGSWAAFGYLGAEAELSGVTR